MKIVIINSNDYGSTGSIMFGVAKEAREQGHSAYSFSRMLPAVYKKEGHSFFGTCKDQNLHIKLSTNLGVEGFFSRNQTKKLIKEIDKIKPDVIHLNILHGWYINLPVLFKYIRKNNIKTFWTFHDCWAFTGHCPHFDSIGCNKWKTTCKKCPQLNVYPHVKRDFTGFMLKQKKKWFTSLKDLTIITPSNWLSKLVKQSFFKDYNTETIYNGINLETFKPTESDFRQKYHLEDKFIVLGVAFAWGDKKGLNDFITLAEKLPSNYQIVLVGTNDNVDKLLPKNVISIHNTYDAKELAGIYTSSDVFVNCTKEEVLGLVNIEANACGTPVITYNTGGSPECIDVSSGVVVEKNDIVTLEKAIIRVCTQKPFKKEDCINRAKLFDKNSKFKEYVALFTNNK